MRRLFLLLTVALLSLAAVSAQVTTAFAEKPALLTSIGQSADLEMVRVLLNRAKVTFTADQLAKASDLNAGTKTLILVVGGSSKGLGAAGISADAELTRAKALIKRARELGMKLIAVHVGGEARRGTLSDIFIELCVPASDYAIVVADADTDGIFTRLAAGAKIALTKVEKITAVGAPLAAVFK
ncbi:MAG: DUF6305 family protein [Spirochaetia bacterium]|jgi:hypothetical protein|nr:DUF6305 family protein [Spirochaetia bacterium]